MDEMTQMTDKIDLILTIVKQIQTTNDDAHIIIRERLNHINGSIKNHEKRLIQIEAIQGIRAKNYNRNIKIASIITVIVSTVGAIVFDKVF